VRERSLKKHWNKGARHRTKRSGGGTLPGRFASVNRHLGYPRVAARHGPRESRVDGSFAPRVRLPAMVGALITVSR
jgi:hypothetical protein